MIYKNALELIGNTPMVSLESIGFENVYVKLEKYNPGGSIKDRIALSMIEGAEKRGILKKGSIIVEATSGNTGIGLAMAGNLKGYKVVIIMPETMSLERRQLVKAFGAELILTEGLKGMNGSIEKLEKLLKEELKKDRTKCQVEGFTKLNLLEMTRKNMCNNDWDDNEDTSV